MRELTRLLGIEQRFTSPYHPACNGLTERTNGSLVNILAMLVEEHQKNWDVVLPQALFNHRACTNTTYGMSPFRMLYGREPLLPFEAMLGDLRVPKLPSRWRSAMEHLEAVHERIKEGHRLVQVSLEEQEERLREEAAKEKGYGRRFQPGDAVLVHYPPVRKGLSRKLKAERWLGPFVVERRIPGLDTYVLRATHKGQVMLKYIHCSRLRLVSERRPDLPVAAPPLPSVAREKQQVVSIRDPADKPVVVPPAPRALCPYVKGDILRVSLKAWDENSKDSCEGYVMHIQANGMVEFICPVDAPEPAELISQLPDFASRYKGRAAKGDKHFSHLIYTLHHSLPFLLERVGTFWRPPEQTARVMFGAVSYRLFDRSDPVSSLV